MPLRNKGAYFRLTTVSAKSFFHIFAGLNQGFVEYRLRFFGTTHFHITLRRHQPVIHLPGIDRLELPHMPQSLGPVLPPGVNFKQQQIEVLPPEGVAGKRAEKFVSRFRLADFQQLAGVMDSPGQLQVIYLLVGECQIPHALL